MGLHIDAIVVSGDARLLRPIILDDIDHSEFEVSKCFEIGLLTTAVW